jgi:hypothetical protein
VTFETLCQAEIDSVLYKVPDAVRFQLKTNPVVLAGGVIRDTAAGLPVKDIDIFCHSAEQAEKLATEAASFVRKTLFAYSVTLDGVSVQYVFYKDFTDAKDLISQFDFRACCAGVYFSDGDFGEWRGVAVEGFHADCRDKVLRFMSQEKDAEKLTALRRALDFAKRGWTISNDEVTNILTHWEPTFEPERVKHSFRPAYGGRLSCLEGQP